MAWLGTLGLVLAASGATGLPDAGSGSRCLTPDRLILVYSGGPYRPRYPVADLQKYVAVIDTAGRPERWLATGTVLLETQAASGRPLTWMKQGPWVQGADWTQFLDSVFRPGGVVQRLDSAVSQAATVLGDTAHRHDLILMLPYPDPRAGTLHFAGGNFDLTQSGGRLAALDAYMAAAEDRFAAGRYHSLRLAGYYWVNEGIFPADLDFTPSVAAHVATRGRRLVWIPDFFDFTHKHWTDVGQLGFHEVFLQPNYFIDSTQPPARLDSAIALARAAGIGLELELDKRYFTDPVFTPRFRPYLDRLAAAPDLRSGPLAFYEGSGALARLASAVDSSDRVLYRAFAAVFAPPQGACP